MKASNARLMKEAEARRKEKPQDLATKKMQAVIEERGTAADNFKIDYKAAARDALNRVQQEWMAREIDQKVKLELENERTQEKLEETNKREARRTEMLLGYNMIEPSKSPWACGVVMANKKGEQLRFCCNVRYLKAIAIKDAYPIPRIDESFSKLGDPKFFTTLDLGSAFWQVPLRKKDRAKLDSQVNWGCNSGTGCPSACATPQRLLKD